MASAETGDASNSQDGSSETGDIGSGGNSNTVEPGAATSPDDEGGDQDEAPAEDTEDIVDVVDAVDDVDSDGDNPTNDGPTNDDESEPEPSEEPDDETSPDTSADDQESSAPDQDPGASAPSAPSTELSEPEPEATESSTLPESESDSAETTGDGAEPATTQTLSGSEGSSDSGAAAPEASDEVGAEAAAIIAMVKELIKLVGAPAAGSDGSSPLTALDTLLQGMWLAGRQNAETRAAHRASVAAAIELVNEAALAELGKSVGWIPVVGTAMYAVSFVGNLGALGAALLSGDQDDIADEFRDLGRDLIGMIPVVGAPAAGTLYDQEAGPGTSARMSALAAAEPAMALAAAAPVGSPEHFLNVLQRAIIRLAGWPGTPRNFVDITNYLTDQTLDNANNQLDGVYAGAPVGSQARWLPDLVSIVSLFFVPAVPGATFTDKLNAMGDFLNRVVPPFKIADGAGTFDIISPYKMMGAAVVGAATLLRDMLNGIYDPVQWEINIIKTTTGATVTESDLNDLNALMVKVGASVALGDGGAFKHPERAWDVTLPTWTEAQVNPYTLTVYVALVGIYKRFQEMARLTTFTTWTTYDSWHYTNGLGMYAAGTFHATDPDGGTIEFRADGTLGKTYTTEGNALVTINTVGGGFTYTPPALWDPKAQGAAFFHRSTAEDPEERFDWVTVEAYSADGVPINLRVGIEIIDGTNAAPVYTGVTGENTDALGVVKGKLTATDSDGDPLRYYLVESSVNGLTGNSAYTKNGAGNGGIVTVSENGDFTYVSSATAGANQSFQVRINDAHYGNTVVTVTVPNTTSITPADVNTSTQNVVTGTVPNSTNKPGAFISYALGGSPTKGSVTSFDPATGAFTYTRNSALGHSTTPDDFVTVIATDADGRQVTLRMAVSPTVPNTPPVANLTTTPTVGSLSGTVQTSTGKITATDADGDSLTYTASGLASGASVTFQSDGTFTYVTNIATSARHAAAKVGATAAQKNQSFTVTVSDGFGGNTNVVVSVPIYAVNAVPIVTSGGQFLGTVGVIKAEDPDGDSISTTRNPAPGSSGYTLSNGGSLTSGSLSAGTATLTFPSGGWPVTIRVYDGYYVVVNGVVTSDLAYGQKVLG